MGRSRYRILSPKHPHFLTCTVVNWLPVFTRPESVEIILDAWRFRQQQHGLILYGYVILENHIHWIAQADDLAKELAGFKAFTARHLLEHLQACKAQRLLRQMAFFKKAHKTDRTYQFWEEGSHPQVIEHPEVMRQKLEYIHQNPVKRGYVDMAVDWRYSSARDYDNRQGLIPVCRAW